MIGVDLVEVCRIAKALDSEGFAQKVYTPAELQYAKAKRNSVESLAGFFCVKEAVSKLLKTGMAQGVSFKNIEVSHDDYGCPYVILSGIALELATGKGYNEIQISISHTQNYAVAMAVAK